MKSTDSYNRVVEFKREGNDLLVTLFIDRWDKRVWKLSLQTD